MAVRSALSGCHRTRAIGLPLLLLPVYVVLIRICAEPDTHDRWLATTCRAIVVIVAIVQLPSRYESNAEA
eukprot:COSAG06_NODE_54669_length_293_cov_1.046392_1_plen_69_part_01